MHSLEVLGRARRTLRLRSVENTERHAAREESEDQHSEVANGVVYDGGALLRFVEEDQLALERLVLRAGDRLVVEQVVVAVRVGARGLLGAAVPGAGSRHRGGGRRGDDLGLGLGLGLEEVEGDGGHRGPGDLGPRLGGRRPERPALGGAAGGGSGSGSGNHRV